MSHSLIFFLLSTYFFIIYPSIVTSTQLSYNVGANERACFYTWSDTPGKKLGFYFAVQAGGSFDIDFEVKDPTNKIILDGKRERQGDYVLTARHVGEYSFCFLNEMSTFAEKLIDFEIGLEQELRAQRLQEKQTADASSIYSTALEESLVRISDTLTSISRLQRHLRTREHRNANTVVSTESRILWFSSLESLAIITMAGLQVFVIQNFFKVKRGGV